MNNEEKIKRLRSLIEERTRKSIEIIKFIDDLLENHEECLNPIKGLGSGDSVFFEFGGMQFYRGIEKGSSLRMMYCAWSCNWLDRTVERALCAFYSPGEKMEESLVIEAFAEGSLWWDAFAAILAKKETLISRILEEKKRWEKDANVRHDQEKVLEDLKKEADVLHIEY